jgi:hypothetical protein
MKTVKPRATRRNTKGDEGSRELTGEPQVEVDLLGCMRRTIEVANANAASLHGVRSSSPQTRRSTSHSAHLGELDVAHPSLSVVAHEAYVGVQRD